jgi:hypothetical protein
LGEVGLVLYGMVGRGNAWRGGVSLGRLGLSCSG